MLACRRRHRLGKLLSKATLAACVTSLITVGLVRMPQTTMNHQPVQKDVSTGERSQVFTDVLAIPQSVRKNELPNPVISGIPRETPSTNAKAGFYANARRQRHAIPAKIAERVKRLVLFVGYRRSCHSLVASLLDAHPHVVISHEYNLLKAWNHWSKTDQRNRTFVFNKIFNISRTQARHGLRSAVLGTLRAARRQKRLAYSYGVPNQWQGNFKEYVDLIGDKNGEKASGYLPQITNVSLKNGFELMKRKLAIELVFIHVLRHPYDNIATMALRKEGAGHLVNGSVRQFQPLRQRSHLLEQARFYVTHLVPNVAAVRSKYPMVDIRCEDLVHDPVRTVRTLCTALNLSCSERYLGDCSRIVRPKLSLTRHFVDWPDWLKKEVATNLSRYAFISSQYRF